MTSQRVTGIALLITGLLLLAFQLDWLNFEGPRLWGIVSLLIGLLMIKKATTNPERKGALGGTFFILFAIFLLMVDSSVRPIPRPLMVGTIFSCLAIANLVYFFVNRWKRNLNLFMFFFFGAIGVSILMVYYQIIDVWQFGEIASTYWPVILIVFGTIILIDSITHRKKLPKEDEFKPAKAEDENTPES